MFVRQGVVVVTVYLVFALLISAVSIVAFQRYTAWSEGVVASTLTSGANGSDHRLRDAEELQSAYAPAMMKRADERLAQLQAMLDKTSELLRQKTDLLNQRTSENRALKGDLDETLNFLVDALDADRAADTPSGAKTSAAEEPRPRVAPDRVESELKSLRDDMTKADFLEQEQAAELEELKDELLQMEAEVTAVQRQTQGELDALAAERDSLVAAATRSLVKSGEAAVPALTELLANERPAVRAWAASVLGELGPVAQEAGPALMNMKSDPDANVRAAAQRALARLTEPKPR
jgi:hypothetical protein